MQLWLTCRSLWDVTQCPPTPSTLMMSCLCGRSFASSDAASCRRTTYKPNVVELWCCIEGSRSTYTCSSSVLLTVWMCLPPESMTISTPSPPVSSRTTGSRSDESLYTGITFTLHTNTQQHDITSQKQLIQLLFSARMRRSTRKQACKSVRKTERKDLTY